MSKSVTFNPVNTVFYTFSSDEYDRSCFASATMPAAYAFRPAPSVIVSSAATVTATSHHQSGTSRPVIKPLDLSIIPNSKRRISEPITPSPIGQQTDKKKLCKKPKLSINTQSLTPLFFTGLSTHYKHNIDDEEEEHGYLIPVMVC